MVKQHRFKNRKKRAQSWPQPVGEQIFRLLEAMGGNRERAKMEQVRKNWSSILGEDLADLVRPAGQHGQTLLLQAADALDMQEARLQSEDILQKINEFLKSEYFKKLKISLANSKE